MFQTDRSSFGTPDLWQAHDGRNNRLVRCLNHSHDGGLEAPLYSKSFGHCVERPDNLFAGFNQCLQLFYPSDLNFQYVRVICVTGRSVGLTGTIGYDSVLDCST